MLSFEDFLSCLSVGKRWLVVFRIILNLWSLKIEDYRYAPQTHLFFLNLHTFILAVWTRWESHSSFITHFVHSFAHFFLTPARYHFRSSANRLCDRLGSVPQVCSRKTGISYTWSEFQFWIGKVNWRHKLCLRALIIDFYFWKWFFYLKITVLYHII